MRLHYLVKLKIRVFVKHAIRTKFYHNRSGFVDCISKNILVCFLVSNDFPKLHYDIGSFVIEFMHDFKYLGHIVSCTLADDDHIMR